METSVVKGVALAFLAYATYALSDASIKLLDGSLDPFLVVFIGALFGILAIPFVKRPGDRWIDLVLSRNWPMWGLRAIMAATGSLASVVAFTALPMAEAFALIFLLPAFVTILSVLFLKEQVGWRRWTAVLIGFGGVLIVLRPGFRELGIGHLAAIASGFSGAVTIILLRKLGGTEKRISLYSAGLIGPIVLSFILMLPHASWPSSGQWLFLTSYGVLSAAGNVFLMLASARVAASLVAPTQYSQMVWAIILGYTVFGDHLDLYMLVGATIIVAAGLFTFVREKQRAPWGRRHPSVHPQ
ncbi:EamA domain-containing membrane protein RarD [Arboricoccus pini]|uniref:EamA domain-containing membrane protein RarD n=1 Tax=Arboricoccus pini TaxID=1963835 RepID=A0A212S0X0_9PROT|nr:EamA domain-containing membrane protein RarD [Arboricoccus pini]